MQNEQKKIKPILPVSLWERDSREEKEKKKTKKTGHSYQISRANITKENPYIHLYIYDYKIYWHVGLLNDVIVTL